MRRTGKDLETGILAAGLEFGLGGSARRAGAGRPSQGLDCDHFFRRHLRRREDPGSHGFEDFCDCYFAPDVRSGLRHLANLLHIAARFFDPDDVGMFSQLTHHFQRQIVSGKDRHAVENDRQG